MVWRPRPQPAPLQGVSLAWAVLRAGAGVRVRPAAPGVPGVPGALSCWGTRRPAREPGVRQGRRGSPRAPPRMSGGNRKSGPRPALFGSPRPRTAPTARSPFLTEVGDCGQKNLHQSVCQDCGDPTKLAVLGPLKHQSLNAFVFPDSRRSRLLPHSPIQLLCTHRLHPYFNEVPSLMPWLAPQLTSLHFGHLLGLQAPRHRSCPFFSLRPHHSWWLCSVTYKVYKFKLLSLHNNLTPQLSGIEPPQHLLRSGPAST